jgi:hypothetical protein
LSGDEFIKIHTSIKSRISSPYDHVIPVVDEPAALFYTDAIRIYFALCSGTVTFDEAYKATEELKKYPEYALQSLDPMYIPLRKETMTKIISNLETANKYNLISSDSIRTACTFALLHEDAPLTESDVKVLKYIGVHVLDTFSNIANTLSMAPQTVSSSVDRITHRIGTRFVSMMDTTAFGAKRVMLFFQLRENVDWQQVSKGLITFPFTKSILKTENSPTGYVVFIVPNYKKALPILRTSIHSLKPNIFENYSIHEERWAGAHANLSLLTLEQWDYPKDITKPLLTGQISSTKPSCYVECQDGIDGLSEIDFVVGNELVLNARGIPTTIKKELDRKGWEYDKGKISRSMQRLQKYELVKPRVSLNGVGLTTNLCIEIACKPQIINKIVSVFCMTPSSVFFGSDKGLVVWLKVPSKDQFEYCKILELLETQKDVESINPIMTIGQRGTRDTLDLVRYWEFRENGWWVPRQQVNLTEYIYY